MHPIISYLREKLLNAGDSQKAKEMQAYMKTKQPFHGVQTPIRKQILNEALNHHKISSREEWETIILELWNGKTREEMYMALDIAERFKKFRTDEAWPLFEKLANSVSNWDTLDTIAIRLIGDLVYKNRDFEGELIKWRMSENFWIRRASLLAHLKHKKDTNTPLLAETILMLAHENEFFIRKAIGWALREYAKTDPEWVKNFINENEKKLSSLSKREALKNIIRKKRDLQKKILSRFEI
jgi:3-methyladenine DNA glycosylase AlkD